MALSDKLISQIREELESCKKPLFFFHDDPDGLCSFLLLYRYMKEGNGIVVKAVPRLDSKFVRKVTEYGPDKVFVLDIAVVEQEFIDECNTPVVWIDHHEPLERTNVKYFNPRIAKHDDNTPVTYTCYQVSGNDRWIAAIGCIADWWMPPFYSDICGKYPNLCGPSIKDPGDALFNTGLGRLAKIFSFVLKGKTTDAMKCVKILTRINGIEELMDENSAASKFLMKRFNAINLKYEEILNDIISKEHDDYLVYIYQDTQTSFTGDLSNEILHRFPEKVVIIGREKDGEIRMSIRGKDKPIAKALEQALIGVNGYGGGHEYACGASVKKEDFELFVSNLRNSIKSA